MHQSGGTSALDAARMVRHRQRRRINHVALALALLAMVSGVFWLAWILWDTLRLGIAGLNWQALTQMTPAPNDAGGIANAMWGSLLMVLVATLLGTPIGVFAGVYLAEYGRNSRLATIIRLVNDVLLSAPSIVIGMFVSTMLVVPFRTFSGWAGSVALALLVIPVVIRTTENMLNLIPASLREAAYALGTPRWRVISSITLKAARAGIVTGVLLAVARIAGETAPLLFTALNNQFWNSDMARPMASLPTMIFKFAMSQYENWQQLAWLGVLVITLAVLLLNILARLLTRQKH